MAEPVPAPPRFGPAAKAAKAEAKAKAEAEAKAKREKEAKARAEKEAADAKLKAATVKYVRGRSYHIGLALSIEFRACTRAERASRSCSCHGKMVLINRQYAASSIVCVCESLSCQFLFLTRAYTSHDLGQGETQSTGEPQFRANEGCSCCCAKRNQPKSR